MTRDEVARLAEAHGLAKLTPKHIDQFAQGVASNVEIAARLPKDLHWTEEMALVLRLRPLAVGQPETNRPVAGPSGRGPEGMGQPKANKGSSQ